MGGMPEIRFRLKLGYNFFGITISALQKRLLVPYSLKANGTCWAAYLTPTRRLLASGTCQGFGAIDAVGLMCQEAAARDTSVLWLPPANKLTEKRMILNDITAAVAAQLDNQAKLRCAMVVNKDAVPESWAQPTEACRVGGFLRCYQPSSPISRVPLP